MKIHSMTAWHLEPISITPAGFCCCLFVSLPFVLSSVIENLALALEEHNISQAGNTLEFLLQFALVFIHFQCKVSPN